MVHSGWCHKEKEGLDVSPFFFQGFGKLSLNGFGVELPWIAPLLPWNDLRPNLLGSSGSKAYKALLCIECVK